MKKSLIYVLAIVFGIIFWLGWASLTIGPISFNCDSFAVDSQGNLYIGRKDSIFNTIFVYKNGSLVRSMPAITDRGYAFTIQPDDTMLWEVNGDVVVTDLYGNELSRAEDPSFHTHNQIAYNKRFAASDGTVYRKRLGFGTFKIYKNDDVIYQHPAYNLYILITTIISGIILLPCVLWIIKHHRRR